MNTNVIAFFNNKGGVGKTSLVYHLSWMYANLGLRVVSADLDPQANLTAAFLDEDRLEQLWPQGDHPETVFGSVHPLMRGTGDIANPSLEYIEDRLSLLVGDLALSGFEDQLSEVWPKCMDRDERAFRVTSSFWRIMQIAAESHKADVILMDLGPNLGAINRAALIAANYIVIPLSPDLFSLQGLRNLGPKLWRWREEWRERLEKNPVEELKLPEGRMQPVGYIVLQHSERLDRPVKAYNRWIARIPEVYRSDVLKESGGENILVKSDPYCLSLLKHYRSLMPMAQEARKPLFHLKPADGAIGTHFKAVQEGYKDFENLAREIARRSGVVIS
ncbi:MAG: chromosome partitioning protein [Deltaproteobacteria bacterium RBG_16_48_10]|nr:MAG: chromosome partitioning protein [Deltaproteobacteria bacterium RBG_16_48_10]